MSFLLSGVSIKSPIGISEKNSTQSAQQRPLAGSIARDNFGSNKRVWTLDYKNVNPISYTAIYNIYSTYLTTNNTVTWQITETNYTIAQTLVHVDLLDRSFSVRGSSYISDFQLVLTEA